MRRQKQMAETSVLMSVYNETLHDLKLSVESILSQSYKDFELIIVVDNPEYTTAIDLLNEYAANDERIKIVVNDRNIGLALSMNVAASYASGEYILRMDSDDVCYPERFQIQIDVIKNSGYDLVCGNYTYIDENDDPVDRTVDVYTDRQINKLLPFRNVIHHPTVIMKASMFNSVGGYRNYDCAQDYDLWLRMLNAGCKFHMVSEPLIKYRIRSTSITVSKRYKQFCTGEYIRSLYHQPKKQRMTEYSYENYKQYLNDRGAESSECQNDFHENSRLYMESKQRLKKGKIFRGCLGVLKVLLFSKYYRPHIIMGFRIAMIRKYNR